MTDVVRGSGFNLDESADREAQQLAAKATSTTIERIETVSGLEVATREPLFGLLSSLADNKYVLGRRYVEWCTGAPMLESAVAAAAMAQDELGHARSFYPLLRGFPEATEAATAEERGWQQRPTSAMACLDQKFESWHDFIAVNLLVDTALTTLLESATDSAYEPLRQRARKIVQEEAAHWEHATGWAQRLAADQRSRATLMSSLQALWDDAFTWFGQQDDPATETLRSAGLIASDPDECRNLLRARLSPVLTEIGLGELLARPMLPWQRWDSVARRLRPSAA
jgi:phenylacetate-CoA oxygenase PaaI subunit